MVVYGEVVEVLHGYMLSCLVFFAMYLERGTVLCTERSGKSKLARATSDLDICQEW